MKNFSYRIVLLSFFCFLTAALPAFHIIGGEIYYVSVGPDPDNPGQLLYRFTMKVYRDCQGGGQNFDSLPGAEPGTVTIYQENNPTPFIPTVILPQPVVTSIPADAGNPCVVVPPNVCVQEGIYTFELSLPEINESYFITYQRCCRNSTISNIYTPDEVGATYTMELKPEAQAVRNSSPEFNEFPPVVICSNESLNIDHSATDPDGDQLVYEFCSPLLGGGRFGGGYSFNGIFPNPDAPPPYQSVNFILPNYSATSPLGVNANLSIDPATGIISGTPVSQGQYVVGICVKEYRNGILLSVVQRDFQFNVAYCEPTVFANLEAELKEGEFTYTSCSDTVIYMRNKSTNLQFIDEYLWIFEGGALSGSPLTFSSRHVTVEFPGPGEYSGMMIVNPGTSCTDTAFVSVRISAPIEPDFTFDYDTCVAGPVSFTNFSFGGDIPIDQWYWNFGDGTETEEQNPIHEYREPGLKEVSLFVTNEIGCWDSIQKLVNWYPVPPLIIIEPSAEAGCPPMGVSFTNLSSPVDDTYDVIWDFGDGGTLNAISPGYIYQAPGTYDVQVDITSPIGCFTSQRFPKLIFVDSFPVADFSYTPQAGISNFNPEVQFLDNSRHARFWEWTFNGEDYTFLKNPTYSFRDTGLQLIELVITHFYGCQDTAQQWIDVEPQITFFMPNAFTPNDDAKNEFFRGGGFFRGIRDYQMTIFDRWGGILFQSHNPEEGWNGRKHNAGAAAANGVYIYHIRFKGPRGQVHEYQGFATLIR